MKRLATLISACLLATGSAASPDASESPNFHFDEFGVSLNIDVVRMPIFPPAMLQSGHLSGIVRIAYDVDQHGELRDWIVLEATHPAFVDSLARVIDSWKFSPPYINGENRAVVGRLVVNFESRNNVVSLDMPSAFLNARLSELTGGYKTDRKIARAEDLDTPPYPVSRVKPSVPKEVIQQHNGSSAVFTFFVDEAGQVRIPALASTSGDPDIGMLLAAQDALAQWRFEPPTKNARPVTVRLAQTFVFNDK